MLPPVRIAPKLHARGPIGADSPSRGCVVITVTAANDAYRTVGFAGGMQFNHEPLQRNPPPSRHCTARRSDRSRDLRPFRPPRASRSRADAVSGRSATGARCLRGVDLSPAARKVVGLVGRERSGQVDHHEDLRRRAGRRGRRGDPNRGVGVLPAAAGDVRAANPCDEQFELFARADRMTPDDPWG